MTWNTEADETKGAQRASNCNNNVGHARDDA